VEALSTRRSACAGVVRRALIRAEIHEYVLRNWRLVKIATTKAQRKLFFNPAQVQALRSAG